MGSEWREVKLLDLGEVARGKSKHRPRYAEHLYGGKYPFIQTGDVKASEGRISSHEQTYSEAGLQQSRLWPAGTMCITIAANIAETGILEYPACFPDSIIGFIANDDVADVYFIEYVFRKLKKDIQRQASGSVQDNINLQTLERLRFKVPSVAVQKRIASYLNVLDKKITLNRQINQTLEQMAQVLFKSWFVDFDPVIDNALAAGNPIPDELQSRAEQRKALQLKASGESDSEGGYKPLPESVRALFPDAFEESELGWVPEGWGVETLENVTSLIIDHRGKTPKKLGSDWALDGYPAISAKNIKDGRLVRHDAIRFVDEALYSKWMKEPLKPNDIVMTSEAPLGELYFLAKKHDYLLSQRVYGIRADNKIITGCYLYYWLQTSKAKADLDGRATGTTVVGIRQSELKKVLVMRANMPVIEVFSALANEYLVKIESNDDQIKALTNLRDTLLPKLISGELQLDQLPDVVESVA